MSVSIRLFWKGITTEQLENQPSFSNPDQEYLWIQWQENIRQTSEAHALLYNDIELRPLIEQSIAVRQIQSATKNKVQFFSPKECIAACEKLEKTILQETAKILTSLYPYEGGEAYKIKSIKKSLLQLKNISKWAEANNHQKICFFVS